MYISIRNGFICSRDIIYSVLFNYGPSLLAAVYSNPLSKWNRMRAYLRAMSHTPRADKQSLLYLDFSRSPA
jgi:hypothetical protein